VCAICCQPILGTEQNEKVIAKWDAVESDAGGTAADFGGDGSYTDIGEWTLDNQTAIVRSYADILTAQSDENKPSALLA